MNLNRYLCITDEDHPVYLVGPLPLLVDQRKLHVEPVSDRGHALGSSGVRTKNQKDLKMHVVLQVSRMDLKSYSR